jgi:hypothetical protein
MNIFLITSTIWGIAILTLLFFPFILYFKHFISQDDNKQKTSVEKIIGVLLKHLFLAFVIVVGAIFIDNVFKIQIFSPCEGTRMFLFAKMNSNCHSVLNVSHITMWDAWDNARSNFYSHNSLNPISQTKTFIYNLFDFIGTFLFLLLIFIPFLMVSLVFVFVLRKMNEAKLRNEYITFTEIIFQTLMFTLVIAFLTYVHLMIFNSAVATIAHVTGFDIWKWLHIAFREAVGIHK